MRGQGDARQGLDPDTVSRFILTLIVLRQQVIHTTSNTERFPMSTQQHELQVKGMSCQHCVKAVTKAIRAKDPQATVDVDLQQGSVKVQTVLSREATAHAISEEGYEVQT